MEVSLNIRPNLDFLDQFPIGAYLQSRYWAEVLRLEGIKNWQLNVVHNHKVVGQCLLYSHKLPFGKAYLYAPKGPLISVTTEAEQREVFSLLLTQIRDITIATQQRQEIFCRLEPNIVPPPLDIPIADTASVEPKVTLLMDLKKNPEEMLTGFKEKTRYNIRLAERKGVTIHWGNDEADIKKFLELLPRTQLRQRIRSHAAKHYRAVINAGKEKNIAQVAWAEYNHQAIAANLYIFFGQTLTYLHGAFNYQYRDVMAPYLLHWEAIKRGHNLGYHYYDFRGLAPRDNSLPSWEGFSRFKRNFGGTEVSSPGAYDFIYIPGWYSYYLNLRQVRRLIRRTIHL